MLRWVVCGLHGRTHVRGLRRGILREHHRKHRSALPAPLARRSLPRGIVVCNMRRGQVLRFPWVIVVHRLRRGEIYIWVGSIRCLDCAAGKVTAVTGQSACTECEAGKYAHSGGNAHCSNCAESYHSKPGAANCSLCAVGYFMFNGRCTACDVGPFIGTSCEDTGLTLSSVTLKPGYWRTDVASPEVFACGEEGGTTEACVGGNVTEKLCAAGHWGPYCSLCAEQYYSPDQKECRSCMEDDSRGLKALFVVGALLLVAAAAAIRYVLVKRRHRRDQAVDTWRPDDNSTVVHRSSVLKLTLVFLQAIASLQEVFSMEFPAPFSEVLEFAHVFALDVSPFAGATPLRCMTGHVPFYNTLVTMTLGPLVLILVRLVGYCWNRARAVAKGRGEFHRTQLLGDVVVILFLMQPIATRAAFQTFVCTDRFDDGLRALEADLTLSCDTTTHAYYSAYAGLMVAVWPIGVTAMFGMALFRKRTLIVPKAEEDVPQRRSGRELSAIVDRR